MTTRFALLLAATLAAAPASAMPPSCSLASAQPVRVCDAQRACINVSPRAICRAAQAVRPSTPRVAIASLSMEEQGRRELDRLIAGLR